MKKAFLQNIGLLVLLNLLIKPIYLFGIDAQVQNAVGPEEYGIYFALFNFVFLFQLILDPGIQNYNSTYLSQNRENLNLIFPAIFTTKLILASFFAVTVYLVAFGLYPQLYFSRLLLIILVQVLASFYLYLRSHLSAMGKYRQDVYFSFLDKLLMIFLVGYFLYFKTIDIEGFLKLQILAFIIALCILLVFLKFSINIEYTFNLDRISTVIKKALPFGMVFLLMTLYTRMDGVMLERLLDDNGYQAGVYAASYRILDAANMIGVLFASLLLPMFAKILKDKKEIEALSSLGLRIILFISTAAVLSSFFFGEEILSFIYDNTTGIYFDSFKLLMLSFIAMSISYIYGTLITASAQLRLFNLIFVIGIIINWSLNLYLIPISGASGAALATLVTQFTVMIAQTILAFSKFQLSINYRLVFSYILLVLFGVLSFHFMGEHIQFNWMINLVSSLILFTIISILIGFIRLKWVFGMAFE